MPRTASIPASLLLLVLCWPQAELGAFEFTQIRPATNGIFLQWTSETGINYGIESAERVTGPWQRRATLNGSSTILSWTDTETGGAAQRFYRITTTNTNGASLRGPLLAADGVPRAVGDLNFDINNIGASAVFLASELGAAGMRLVTNGTLTEAGQNWTYAASPADRLAVRFASGTNADFYIGRMEGNFSSDAATFLRQGHNFDFRVVVSGVGDLFFSSSIAEGTCNFRSTSRGTLLWNGVNYTLDLVFEGQYCFEGGFGSYSLLNDYTTRGTVAAAAYSLVVDQRWRFELVADGSTSASSAEDWNNNTLTLGADTYQWTGAKKQKSFKNGKPSSTDSYWQAFGGVLKNGANWGLYRYVPPDLFGFVKFNLVIPGEVIELESWNIR